MDELVRFLTARCEEQLRDFGCSYEELPEGHLHCSCDRPDAARLEVLALFELIKRWSDSPGKRDLLRLLADGFANHPEHQSDWHRIA